MNFLEILGLVLSAIWIYLIIRYWTFTKFLLIVLWSKIQGKRWP